MVRDLLVSMLQETWGYKSLETTAPYIILAKKAPRKALQKQSMPYEGNHDMIE